MPTKLEDGFLPSSVKKSYSADISLSYDDYSMIFDFAHEMVFGKGYHRSNRSGGTQQRNPLLTFKDVMEGKIGEFSFYRFLENNNITVTKPDCSIHGKGSWDSGDFYFLDKYSISLKTSKHFAQLLLLESSDYIIKGNKVYYKPDNHVPDVIVFTRTFNKIADFLKQHNGQDIYSLKEGLYNYSKITCEISGYINNKDLKNLILNGFKINKLDKLNGKITMDADNYYIPIKEMKSKEKLCEIFKKIK